MAYSVMAYIVMALFTNESTEWLIVLLVRKHTGAPKARRPLLHIYAHACTCLHLCATH